MILSSATEYMGKNDKPPDLWTPAARGVSCPRPQGPTCPDSLNDEWRAAISICILLFLTPH